MEEIKLGVRLLEVLEKLGLGKLLRGIGYVIFRFFPDYPRRTIRIVTIKNKCRWHLGAVSGKDAMQVTAEFKVTNITDQEIYLVGAELEHLCDEGFILTKHPSDNIYGSFPVLSRSTTNLHVHFWVKPPICEKYNDFIGSVVVLDQFGNKNLIKDLTFKGGIRPDPPEKELEKENIGDILDPTEKKIVAILKDETSRYKECGRKVGGLGSVTLILDGRKYNGFGTEWRKVDSSEQQNILLDTSRAVIESDNLDRLIEIYNSSDEKRKQKIISALVSRIDRNLEYAPIGYLIILALLNMDSLTKGLEKAKKDLAGDNGYGFSEVLRAIDALLRLKHDMFKETELETIEHFIGDLEEHTFRISERLAAVLAYRSS